MEKMGTDMLTLTWSLKLKKEKHMIETSYFEMTEVRHFKK